MTYTCQKLNLELTHESWDSVLRDHYMIKVNRGGDRFRYSGALSVKQPAFFSRDGYVQLRAR